MMRLKRPNLLLLSLPVFFVGLFLMVSYLPARLVNMAQPHKDLPHLNLTVEKKHFKRLTEKRNEAIERGQLLTSDNDEVPGRLSHGGQDHEVRMRLKGDLTDHLEGENWSLRVKLRSDSSVFGMRKFSLQHPETRHYMAEWFIQMTRKHLGLMHLRFFPVQVSLNGKSLGVYVLEEHFDKILIANNRRREGLIMAFDEGVNWEQQYFVGNSDVYRLETYEIMDVRVYDERKVRDNPILMNQYLQARSLFRAWQKGELKASQIFNVKQVAKHFAIMTLMGGAHGGHPGNIRAYFNPITRKFELVGYDHDGFGVLQTMLGESGAHSADVGYHQTLYKLWQDPQLAKAYLAACESLASKSFLQALIENLGDEVNSVYSYMLQADANYKIPFGTLKANVEFIQSKILPKNIFYGEEVARSARSITLRLGSSHTLPVKVYGLVVDGDLISENQYDFSPRAFLSEVSYKSLKFRLKRPIAKGEKVQLLYSAQGVKGRVSQEYLPLNKVQPHPGKLPKAPSLTKVLGYKSMSPSSSRDFLYIKRGVWTFNRSLVIPPGTRLGIPPRTQLIFTEGSELISYSPVEILGIGKNTVVIQGAEGVTLADARGLSKIQGLVLKDLGQRGLHIENSRVNINNLKVYGAKATALTCKGCHGVFENLDIKVEKNALRFISGEVDIYGLKVQSKDGVALSAGQSSRVKLYNGQIFGGFLGLAGYDLSRLEVRNTLIRGIKVGYSFFSKQIDYGHSAMVAAALEIQKYEHYAIADPRALVIDNRRKPSLAPEQEQKKLLSFIKSLH